MLPNAPVACILSIGLIVACCIFGLTLILAEGPTSGACRGGAELGGFPIKVSLSQDGSSSDRASRSQEDLEILSIVELRGILKMGIP